MAEEISTNKFNKLVYGLKKATKIEMRSVKYMNVSRVDRRLFQKMIFFCQS